MTDLKPCPFCGGEAERDSEYSLSRFCGKPSTLYGWFHATCGDCGVSGPTIFADNDEQSVEALTRAADTAWNRREG